MAGPYMTPSDALLPFPLPPSITTTAIGSPTSATAPPSHLAHLHWLLFSSSSDSSDDDDSDSDSSGDSSEDEDDGDDECDDSMDQDEPDRQQQHQQDAAPSSVHSSPFLPYSIAHASQRTGSTGSAYSTVTPPPEPMDTATYHLRQHDPQLLENFPVLDLTHNTAWGSDAAAAAGAWTLYDTVPVPGPAIAADPDAMCPANSSHFGYFAHSATPGLDHRHHHQRTPTDPMAVVDENALTLTRPCLASAPLPKSAAAMAVASPAATAAAVAGAVAAIAANHHRPHPLSVSSSATSTMRKKQPSPALTTKPVAKRNSDTTAATSARGIVWTEAEVEALKSAVAIHGQQWSKIWAMHGPSGIAERSLARFPSHVHLCNKAHWEMWRKKGAKPWPMPPKDAWGIDQPIPGAPKERGGARRRSNRRVER
ncbi:hypothetical protein BC828DRAFT_380976 [Blastocladiella britannica]|nr:hypothetical protein BC828DRAFT_380976 [Blastocladiella britannica]